MKLSSFRFKNENTILHRLDPRVKIIIIAILSSVLILADFYQLILVGIVVLLSGFIGKVNLPRTLWETKPFLILIGFIFLVHSLNTSGEVILSFWRLKITVEGLLYGGKVISRLVFIVMLGFVYSASTPPEGTRSAVEWFLRPLPLNEKILGTSASLGTRFLPMVVEDTKKIQEAQKARYIEGAGPLKRLKNVVSSLLNRALRHAERISLAMDARCYSTNKSSPIQLNATAKDHIVLFSMLVLVAFLHLTMFYWQ